MHLKVGANPYVLTLENRCIECSPLMNLEHSALHQDALQYVNVLLVIALLGRLDYGH